MSMKIATADSLIPLKLYPAKVRAAWKNGVRLSHASALFAFIVPKRLFSHPALTPTDFVGYASNMDKAYAHTFNAIFLTVTDVVGAITNIARRNAQDLVTTRNARDLLTAQDEPLNGSQRHDEEEDEEDEDDEQEARESAMSDGEEYEAEDPRAALHVEGYGNAFARSTGAAVAEHDEGHVTMHGTEAAGPRGNDEDEDDDDDDDVFSLQWRRRQQQQQQEQEQEQERRADSQRRIMSAEEQEQATHKLLSEMLGGGFDPTGELLSQAAAQSESQEQEQRDRQRRNLEDACSVFMFDRDDYIGYVIACFSEHLTRESIEQEFETMRNEQREQQLQSDAAAAAAAGGSSQQTGNLTPENVAMIANLAAALSTAESTAPNDPATHQLRQRLAAAVAASNGSQQEPQQHQQRQRGRGGRGGGGGPVQKGQLQVDDNGMPALSVWEPELYNNLCSRYLGYFGCSYAHTPELRQKFKLAPAAGKAGLPTSVLSTENMVRVLVRMKQLGFIRHAVEHPDDKMPGTDVSYAEAVKALPKDFSVLSDLLNFARVDQDSLLMLSQLNANGVPPAMDLSGGTVYELSHLDFSRNVADGIIQRILPWVPKHVTDFVVGAGDSTAIPRALDRFLKDHVQQFELKDVEPVTPYRLLIEKMRSKPPRDAEEQLNALECLYYVMDNVRLRQFLPTNYSNLMYWGDKRKTLHAHPDAADRKPLERWSVQVAGKIIGAEDNPELDGYGALSRLFKQTEEYATELLTINRNNADLFMLLLTAGTNRYNLVDDKNICIIGVGPGESSKSDTLKQALGLFVDSTNTWNTQESTRAATSQGGAMNCDIEAYDERPSWLGRNCDERLLSEYKAILSTGYGTRAKTEEYLDENGNKRHRSVRKVTERQIQIYLMCNDITTSDDALLSRFTILNVARNADIRETAENIGIRQSKKELIDAFKRTYGPLYHSLQYIVSYMHAAINVNAIVRPSQDMSHVLLTKIIDIMNEHNVTKIANPRNYWRVMQHAEELCLWRVALRAYFTPGGFFYKQDFHVLHLLELQKMMYHTIEDLFVALCFYRQQYFDEVEMGVARFIFDEYTPLTPKDVAFMREKVHHAQNEHKFNKSNDSAPHQQQQQQQQEKAAGPTAAAAAEASGKDKSRRSKKHGRRKHRKEDEESQQPNAQPRPLSEPGDAMQQQQQQHPATFVGGNGKGGDDSDDEDSSETSSTSAHSSSAAAAAAAPAAVVPMEIDSHEADETPNSSKDKHQQQHKKHKKHKKSSSSGSGSKLSGRKRSSDDIAALPATASEDNESQQLESLQQKDTTGRRDANKLDPNDPLVRCHYEILDRVLQRVNEDDKYGFRIQQRDVLFGFGGASGNGTGGGGGGSGGGVGGRYGSASHEEEFRGLGPHQQHMLRNGAGASAGGPAGGGILSSETLDQMAAYLIDLNYLMQETDKSNSDALYGFCKDSMSAFPAKSEITRAFNNLTSTNELVRLWWQPIPLSTYAQHIEVLYTGGSNKFNNTFVHPQQDRDARIAKLRKYVPYTCNERKPMLYVEYSKERRRINLSIAYQVATKDDCSILTSCMRTIANYAGIEERRILVPLLEKQFSNTEEKASRLKFADVHIKADALASKTLRFVNPKYMDPSRSRNVELASKSMLEDREERERKRARAYLGLLNQQAASPTVVAAASTIRRSDSSGDATAASAAAGEAAQNASGVPMWRDIAPESLERLMQHRVVEIETDIDEFGYQWHATNLKRIMFGSAMPGAPGSAATTPSTPLTVTPATPGEEGSQRSADMERAFRELSVQQRETPALAIELVKSKFDASSHSAIGSASEVNKFFKETICARWSYEEIAKEQFYATKASAKAK
jgi:hypothetical protein